MNRIMVAAPASASGGARRAVFMRLFPVVLGVSVLCLSVPGYGQDGVPALGGVWRNEANRFVPPYMFDYGRSNDGVIDGFDNPILRPWTAEILMEKSHYEISGRIIPTAITTCWPAGVPGVHGLNAMQILQTPDEITIVYDRDTYARHIPLNRPHARPVEPNWHGNSVGHFEGDTLVVDTIGFYARPEAMVDDYGTPVSDALHVVERYRVHNDGRNLQVDVTVEDPNVFKKSWSMTLDNYASDIMLREGPCAENNRDWLDLMPIAETPDF